MKTRTSPFRELFRLFRHRFFESDEAAPEASFATNIYQLLGILAVPGVFTALLAGPAFEQIARRPPGPELDWTVRMHLLVYPACSFAVTGFATFFEWDTLFPDRRDFMVLAAFPIRLRDLFAAKVAAICALLLLLLAAVDAIPLVLVPVFASQVGQLRQVGMPAVMLTHFVATASAATFAFFAVAGLQGLLINFTSPRVFKRISPWIQMLGMSLMVLTLALFPLYATAMRMVAEHHPQRFWYFPLYWFGSTYDLLIPAPEPLLLSVAPFAFKALAVAIAIFALTWAAGFRSHYRRTLEAERHVGPALRFQVLACSPLRPIERAFYEFSLAALTRSNKHRLFLATYMSAAIALGVLVTVTVENDTIGISPFGLRALPFLLIFFMVSGLRTAFQFPAELRSNWIFQICEDRWSEVSRKASRRCVLTAGLLPLALLLVPLEIFAWGWMRGLFHFTFQIATGMLLIEILFWNFDKVPFTCSYFPGKMNLALLGGLYLYGFTLYSFQMANLEALLETHWAYGLSFLLATGTAFTLLWHRDPPGLPVIFDGNEPEIQTFDLT